MSTGDTNMQGADSSSSQSNLQPQVMPETLRQSPQDGFNYVLEIQVFIFTNQEINNDSSTTTGTGAAQLLILMPARANWMDFLTDDKEGLLPASKDAIDAMPRITVKQGGNDCAICLDEIGVDCELREMPCQHGFHSGCIEKWLGIHGSCPVCRFTMHLKGEIKSAGGSGS